MATTAIDAIATARLILEQLYDGNGIAGLITTDFVHYRNTGEVTMDAETALADHARMRACVGSVTIAFERMLATAQGVVCEPRIAGTTTGGAQFILRPMVYVQIDSDGHIYRIDEYVDSAALEPLAAVGYAPTT